MSDGWHSVVPLLLHSRHLRVERMLGVSRRLDAMARDVYRTLHPYRQLEYVCAVAERRMQTRLIRMLGHLASLPTAEDVVAVLVGASAESYWTMIASIGEEGRLWRFLDCEWRMCASKHHVHALAMSNVVNQPHWLRVLRAQVESGAITPEQLTRVRLALYSRFLRTLDDITAFHNAHEVAC